MAKEKKAVKKPKKKVIKFKPNDIVKFKANDKCSHLVTGRVYTLEGYMALDFINKGYGEVI